VTGVIEEADQGESKFTLRQLDLSNSAMGETAEIRFRFDDHLYDAVMDAFNSLERMMVVGERVDSDYQALDVQEAIELTNGTPGVENSTLE
jgi:hypothetical protein